MRVLTEGFELGTYQLTGGIWTGLGYFTTGRDNGFALQTGNFGGPTSYTLPNPLTELYIRFAWKFLGGWTNPTVNFRLVDEMDTPVASFRWSINTLLEYERYSEALTYKSNALMKTDWQLVEIHFRHAVTNGAVGVRVDGRTYLNFVGRTAVAELPLGVTKIQWPYSTWAIDDLAINDTTGATDNSWCGDGHVVGFYPNGNGDSSQFVGSDGDSVDNWVLVRDRDQTYTFVQSDATGATDLYQMAEVALQPNDSVRRVWVTAVAKEATADADGLSVGFKTAGTAVWDPADALDIGWRGYDTKAYATNPVTGQPWTQADLNALQAGVKVP